METPSMDTVYQAISALYDNPNSGEKEKASIWLGEIQKSIHSWKIADELLQHKKDVHSCYFAAQTMRSKVQHNLSELPSESLISLRDSLINNLEGTSPDTNAAILTQLSLALADLALQMPQWQNCLTDIISAFSNKNHYALLEILTVLPQEIDSSNLKLGENRRESIKQELRSNAHIVNLFLKESIVSSQTSHIALKIVKCLISWIQVNAINIGEIPQNAVVGFCFQVLRDHNSINMLHDAACDCICALLHCITDNRDNEDVDKLLFESVLALEESYHMAVAHEEEEKAANYARLFTELGEAFLTKIIDATANGCTHYAVRSLELALVCVGHHDYEIAEITFNLWYKLSDEIYQRDYQPLADAFKPHIERLIEALARHCQCEPDQTQIPEEGDEFYEFRRKVMGLIKDVVFIVGSSSVFKQMFSTLQADLSWEKTEAALFVMQAVAKNILPEEYEYVPKVVEAILSMPAECHPGVRKTCILVLGELCEWVQQHGPALAPSLALLLAALQHPPLQPHAALALQSICSACRQQASEHWRALLEAWRQPLAPPAAAALGRALGAALQPLPPAQLREAMREAVSVPLVPLAALVAEGGGGGGDPAALLDKLAALFRDVAVTPHGAAVSGEGEGNNHPCLPALVDAWPVIRDVIHRYGGESRVMERACRALRYGVRCVRAGAAPLLDEVCQCLAAAYRRWAASCVLYVAGVLLDELWRRAAPLLRLLELLLPQALAALTPPARPRDCPDTVDDLFRLCVRFLQRTPLQFLCSAAVEDVVACARAAAALDHRDANAAVMRFLLALAAAANATAHAHPDAAPASADADPAAVARVASEVVSKYGAELTFVLIEASAIHLHSYMLCDVAEVLVELAAFQRRHGLDWLRPALARLPQGPAAPTPHQAMQFHHEAMRAEKCKEMTRLLCDFAKLYR
ncbi:hypothetical protein ACJJTC_003262 [Scirpophaga incertulas]